MNVRCGKGRKVHIGLFHPLGGERYIQTACGYAGSLTSPFGYRPWMRETQEPVSCRSCLATSNQESRPEA